MDDFQTAMEGVEPTNVEVQLMPLLSEEEKRVLDIYDRLEELQLEVALLRAQGVLSQDIPQDVSNEQINLAQQELLEAKAVYQVRGNIIENVLIANPIIKAVHAGNYASVAEQDLLPFIEQRDDLSIALTQLSKKVSTAREELIQVQKEHIITARNNTELAALMTTLAKEASMQKKENIKDSKTRQQFDEVGKSSRASKRKWRIMKGTASATIVGSGVDWARDPELLEIVLDDEAD